jgi:hypothetical protein
MATRQPLSQFIGEKFIDPHLFRSIVGALQYTTITRSNISFTVNHFSQFMHAPISVHWTTIKMILRYLNGTIDYEIIIQPSSSFTVHVFADSDWAGCPDD